MLLLRILSEAAGYPDTLGRNKPQDNTCVIRLALRRYGF